MATPVRYFQKGLYHHIYNRGNRKQNIFIQRRDYLRFLKRTLEYKNKYKICILCYCLMPNHFHFLLRQDGDIPITNFMLSLSTSYAKYFNIKYDEIGSLLQSPFKAKLVETDEQLLQVSRYIHRNALDILLPTPRVELANYEWSSYPSYIENVKDDLVDTSIILNYFKKTSPQSDYKNFVEFDFKENDNLLKNLAFDPSG